MFLVLERIESSMEFWGKLLRESEFIFDILEDIFEESIDLLDDLFLSF